MKKQTITEIIFVTQVDYIRVDAYAPSGRLLIYKTIPIFFIKNNFIIKKGGALFGKWKLGC